MQTFSSWPRFSDCCATCRSVISVDLYSALMSYSQYEGRGRGFARVRQGGGGLGRDGEPHKILQPKFHLWHHAIMHAQTLIQSSSQ